MNLWSFGYHELNANVTNWLTKNAKCIEWHLNPVNLPLERVLLVLGLWPHTIIIYYIFCLITRQKNVPTWKNLLAFDPILILGWLLCTQAIETLFTCNWLWLRTKQLWVIGNSMIQTLEPSFMCEPSFLHTDYEDPKGSLG